MTREDAIALLGCAGLVALSAAIIATQIALFFVVQ